MKVVYNDIFYRQRKFVTESQNDPVQGDVGYPCEVEVNE